MDESCNNTYHEDNRIINSPNYPRVYPRFTECTWSIAAPIGSQISVDPFFYSIEEAYMRIYDGAFSYPRRIAILNGIDTYDGTNSTTNNMFFWFESSWKEDKGFQITFSLIGMQMNFIN